MDGPSVPSLSLVGLKVRRERFAIFMLDVFQLHVNYQELPGASLVPKLFTLSPSPVDDEGKEGDGSILTFVYQHQPPLLSFLPFRPPACLPYAPHSHDRGSAVVSAPRRRQILVLESDPSIRLR